MRFFMDVGGGNKKWWLWGYDDENSVKVEMN